MRKLKYAMTIIAMCFHGHEELIRKSWRHNLQIAVDNLGIKVARTHTPHFRKPRTGVSFEKD